VPQLKSIASHLEKNIQEFSKGQVIGRKRSTFVLINQGTADVMEGNKVTKSLKAMDCYGVSDMTVVVMNLDNDDDYQVMVVFQKKW